MSTVEINVVKQKAKEGTMAAKKKSKEESGKEEKSSEEEKTLVSQNIDFETHRSNYRWVLFFRCSDFFLYHHTTHVTRAHQV
jgi:hypothetical protein